MKQFNYLKYHSPYQVAKCHKVTFTTTVVKSRLSKSKISMTLSHIEPQTFCSADQYSNHKAIEIITATKDEQYNRCNRK